MTLGKDTQILPYFGDFYNETVIFIITSKNKMLFYNKSDDVIPYFCSKKTRIITHIPNKLLQ